MIFARYNFTLISGIFSCFLVNFMCNYYALNLLCFEKVLILEIHVKITKYTMHNVLKKLKALFKT